MNGEPAIGLAIAMREGGDILALGANIKQLMARVTADLPVGIEPKLIADQAVTVDGAISEFMTSLLQAIAIILVVSFISLGVRPGLIIALSIPLTLAIVFPVMKMAGIDMQRISLGALIIALALLVDDAMTTTDATLNRLAEGDDKVEAATYAFRTYAFAMLAGTLVTIAGFVPVGFAASSAGEYTFSLFAVVSIALIVSWFVAVIFAPLLGVIILTPPKAAKTAQPGRVFRWYRSFLTLAMRAKWLTIFVSLALFVGSFLALPLIPRQFFPSSDRPELLVDLGLPQNASIYASENAAQRLDAALKGDPDVARWSTYVGRGAIRFYLPLNVQLPNNFFTQVVIVAKDVAARERLRLKLEKILADQFPSAISRVYPLELGPPVGWPVQYRVSGPDVDQVRTIALKLAQIIATNPKAEKVNFDWIEPARQVRIRVDQDEARLLGLSSQALAGVLNTVISGTSVTQVRDDIYLIDVIARATDEQRVSLATLRTLQVPLPGGRTVPLSQFATFEYEQEYPLIWRRDRVPTLTVQADIVAGALPETVVTSLSPAVETLRKTLPPSYHIVVGGTVEESKKSQASVIAVVPVMLLIMLTVLMVAAAELPTIVPGPQRSASRAGRRRRGAPAVWQTAGLRCDSGHPGAPGHDHQECGDLDRPDRGGALSGKNCLGSCRRCQQLPFPPDYANGRVHRSRHDTDRSDGVLGANGLCDHGRLVGRDDPDADLSAHIVCCLVQGDRRIVRSFVGSGYSQHTTQARASDHAPCLASNPDRQKSKQDSGLSSLSSAAAF